MDLRLSLRPWPAGRSAGAAFLIDRACIFQNVESQVQPWMKPPPDRPAEAQVMDFVPIQHRERELAARKRERRQFEQSRQEDGEGPECILSSLQQRSENDDCVLYHTTKNDPCLAVRCSWKRQTARLSIRAPAAVCGLPPRLRILRVFQPHEHPLTISSFTARFSGCSGIARSEPGAILAAITGGGIAGALTSPRPRRRGTLPASAQGAFQFFRVC